jgi:hypothetical protein
MIEPFNTSLSMGAGLKLTILSFTLDDVDLFRQNQTADLLPLSPVSVQETYVYLASANGGESLATSVTINATPQSFVATVACTG